MSHPTDPTEPVPDSPTPALLARVSAALGERVVSWQQPECGLSAAERWITGLADGTGVFVKAATDEDTANWLANERDALLVAGVRFGPEVIAWLDDDEYPVLVTRELSDGYWPAATGTVHWRDGDVDAVLSDLALLRARSAGDLRPIPDPPGQWTGLLSSDVLVRAGLCTTTWISENGAALAAADARPLPGVPRVLTHGDVRSDNLCVLSNGQARFVDWSHAGSGHPLWDLATALPTLRLEGGPAPSTVITEPAELITRLAGQTVARATGDHTGPDWLRQVMIRLAEISFQWVCETLQLAPPDGRRPG